MFHKKKDVFQFYTDCRITKNLDQSNKNIHCTAAKPQLRMPYVANPVHLSFQK